jgi:hypothetical protein
MVRNLQGVYWFTSEKLNYFFIASAALNKIRGKYGETIRRVNA